MYGVNGDDGVDGLSSRTCAWDECGIGKKFWWEVRNGLCPRSVAIKTSRGIAVRKSKEEFSTRNCKRT